MKTIKDIFYKVFNLNFVNFYNNELINFYDHKNENFNGIVLFHDKNFNTIEIGLRDELDYDNFN
jgi:hypothetical protein